MATRVRLLSFLHDERLLFQDAKTNITRADGSFIKKSAQGKITIESLPMASYGFVSDSSTE
jgi:hypothetical protein